MHYYRCIFNETTPLATVSFLFGEKAQSRPTGAIERLQQRRDTKSIGDRSEAMVLAALVRNGYQCSIPFGENRRYDILADDGERIHRVQVKTG